MSIPEIKSHIFNLKRVSEQLESRLNYMNNRIYDLENSLFEIEDRTFNERFDRVNQSKVCSI